MDGKTESTFERADMVFEEIRIFIQVDGFERKFSESFSSVGICA